MAPTSRSKKPSPRRSSATRRIIVVVVSPVDELDLVGPLQVFNSVNRLAGRPIYSIEVVTNADDRTIAGEGGVLTFVGVLQEAGTVEWVGNGVAGLGVPLLVALLLCYIGAIVSAFASSTAILGVTIPLAVPFLLAGDVGAIGVIVALSIASTIVDVSPFSTNGALVLANAQGVDRDVFYKQILKYSALVVVIGPAIAWAILVVPGWL